MEIAIQIADVLTVILGGLHKSKPMALVFNILNNVVLAIMFFIFDRVSTALICIVAILRSVVFLLFSLKKLKPNVFVLIAFEITYLLIVVFTWKDALDLLPLIGTAVSCYTSWQDNVALMRIGYMINPIFYIIYKLIIGAYISIITEAILFLTNLVSLVYYNILKKEKPILSYLNIFKKDKNKLENANTENLS